MHVSAAIPSLHEALSKTWGIPMDPDVRAQNTLSEEVPCAKIRDFIHMPCYLHSKVVSHSQAHQLMRDLANVTVIYMNIRFLNEPCCFIEDPGMISFLPWGHQYVYHVFPYAKNCLSERTLRELITTVAAKKLYVFGGPRHQIALAKFVPKPIKVFDIILHPAVQALEGKLPHRISMAATGHRNCQATFNNIFHNPSDATRTALTHVGAEMYAASRLYPKNE
jgi:hypothetical protein